jgi:hypothetical protein
MPMSKDHKQALLEGRRQSRIVKRYLEALQVQGGASRTSKSTLEARIERMNDHLTQEQNPLQRLQLRQRVLDSERQLQDLNKAADLKGLEEEFVGVARKYSERKGISYSAWRGEGVPASTLREAGVPRTHRS